jgi:hypothetical protein
MGTEGETSFFKRLTGGIRDSTLQMSDDRYATQRQMFTRELSENLQALGVSNITGSR